jgi:hypothetical protein
MYTVGPSSPEGAQLTVRGGGFLLYAYFGLGYFVCYYVFVVYISLRDDGRYTRINQSINQSLSPVSDSCWWCGQ